MKIVRKFVEACLEASCHTLQIKNEGKKEEKKNKK